MTIRFASWQPAATEGAGRANVARWIPVSLADETMNNALDSEKVMQGIDAFLDTYVRIDEGTRVLLIAHRSCARTAAWLYAAIFVRGTEPVTFCFDDANEDAEETVAAMLDDLRARPSVRRVAVIVCEPQGPSFVRLFDRGPRANPDKVPVFRITAGASSISAAAKRTRNYAADALLDEALAEEDEHGLSDSDIDELLEQCEFEMADLDDWDIEEIAAMSDEEIGSLTDEELAALAELEDSELLELASGWGEEGFRVLA